MVEGKTAGAGDPILVVRELYRHFGGIKAVNGVSLEVGRREIAGLIGPNGSGKSTLFSLVSGTVAPDRGQIRFDGHEIGGRKAHAIARLGLARTFQIPAMFDNMSVTENLLAAAAEGHWQGARDRAAETLALLTLDHVADNRASDLSGGQQKLLEFGRVIMRQATLILLDEVTAGVHPNIRKIILEPSRGCANTASPSWSSSTTWRWYATCAIASSSWMQGASWPAALLTTSFAIRKLCRPIWGGRNEHHPHRRKHRHRLRQAGDRPWRFTKRGGW
ncbi:ATP-binding cassette domain-containing protein [Mesorhizobium sp. M1156]|uniref:ABC transporter ATP-binding protein n=1 Tax=Mesorhizobium sp. M1156 TaxID=2957064 RepID=UPI00333BC16A